MSSEAEAGEKVCSAVGLERSPIGGAELERLRRDTPSTARWLHLDHAGASPTPAAVHARTVEHLELEREIGGYAAMRAVREELAGLYSSIAALIGAEPDQVCFAESATRAWDMAFYGIELAPGDKILTSRAEYSSNYLAFLQAARDRGAEIEIVPDGQDGTIDVAALAARLDDRVKIVNICHAPTSNGLVQDAERAGEALRGHPALYILDACQSAGQLEIDVRRIGCDALSATGRKYLRGPRGTGFLYLSRRGFEKIRPPFVDIRAARWTSAQTYQLRPDVRRFEPWETAMSGRLGLKTAIDYALRIGIDRIERRIATLAGRLRSSLEAIGGVDLLDRGSRQSGIVTFAIDGQEPLQLRDRLFAQGVAVTVLSRGDAVLDLERSGRSALLRASVHCINTEAEVDRFVELVEGLAASR